MPLSTQVCKISCDSVLTRRLQDRTIDAPASDKPTITKSALTLCTTIEKVVGTVPYFLGRLWIEVPLQWAYSEPTRLAAPTNSTVWVAGDTSHLYKWVDL